MNQAEKCRDDQKAFIKKRFFGGSWQTEAARRKQPDDASPPKITKTQSDSNPDESFLDWVSDVYRID